MSELVEFINQTYIKYLWVVFMIPEVSADISIQKDAEQLDLTLLPDTSDGKKIRSKTELLLSRFILLLNDFNGFFGL